MLDSGFAPIFLRDIKKLQKKHVDTSPLRNVIRLILENTAASQSELIQRHNMHTLSGQWSGSYECHVCNIGDWLLVWTEADGLAYFQRTGSHDDIFRR